MVKLGRFMYWLGLSVGYLKAKYRLGRSSYIRNDAINVELCAPIRWGGE